MSEEPTGPPRLTLTSPRLLVTALLVGAVLMWIVNDLIGRAGMTPLSVPPTAPLLLALAAIVVAVFGWRMRQRVQLRGERVDPFEAVKLLVLGKSAALGGATIVGGYLAYALINIGRWEAAAPRERAIWSLAAVVASLLLVAAGLFLERACRRRDGDEDDETDPADPEPAG